MALTGRVGQIRAEGAVLPGVREAITALAEAGAVQTLVTGNLAPNARTKLAASASSPTVRSTSTSAPTAATTTTATSSCPSPCVAVPGGGRRRLDATWVVGDTPRDLVVRPGGRGPVPAGRDRRVPASSSSRASGPTPCSRPERHRPVVSLLTG